MLIFNEFQNSLSTPKTKVQSDIRAMSLFFFSGMTVDCSCQSEFF